MRKRAQGLRIIRTMTRSICGGDSGDVNLVLGSFVVSCMVIRTLFSHRLSLMSHPLPGQYIIQLLQLVFAGRCISRGAEYVLIKKLRDKIVIPEMHSSILVNGVGKTDPFVPLDMIMPLASTLACLPDAIVEHDFLPSCSRLQDLTDRHDYMPVSVCWNPHRLVLVPHGITTG